MSVQQPKGITAISVSGFKSIRDETRIEIRPLTLLAGANSSGKSSIMQPLLMMKQTLDASSDRGPLKLDGPNVTFTSINQFLFRNNQKVFSDLKITLDINHIQGSSSLISTFQRITADKKRRLDLTEMIYSRSDEKIVLRPNMFHEEIVSQIPRLSDYIDASTRWHVFRQRCFLGVDPGPFNFQGLPIHNTLLVNPGSEFENEIAEVIHVPGLRGNPQRTYPTTSMFGPRFEGTFENYIASIIDRWKEKEPANLDALIRLMGSQRLALTSGLTTKTINDVEIELRVNRLIDTKNTVNPNDMVRIADVGFGISQILPALVALLVAEPGQLVYIEQPELHLHPRAQVALASVLADAAKRGVRIVAETHSALLLLGIQTLIAEGQLPPEDVILHWFKRNEEGNTEVNSVQPDENGSYGDWPEDFADAELDAQSKYLQAVEKRELRRHLDGQKS